VGGRIWVGARGEDPRELSGAKAIPSPARLRLIGFSPDGSRLAALADNEVWVVPYPADAPLQRYSVSSVQAASWMSGSRRLVLTRILGPEAHTLSMLDIVSGDHRVFYGSPHAMMSGAVSRDGKRLAYVAGRIEWNIVEISTANARTRTLNTSGDIAQHPAWAPGGTRYLFASYRGGRWGIEEASVAEGLSRRLVEIENGSAAFVSLAPDGRQVTFLMYGPEGARVMLANLSGRMSALDPGAPGPTGDAIWSPDGRYVIYARTIPGERVELARIRPGSTSAAEVLARYPLADAERRRLPVAWSPDGTHILTQSAGARTQFYLSTADFTSERPLPSERLCRGATGFSKSGRDVLSVCRNTSAAGAPWQLWSVDVTTSRETLVGNVDLTVTPDTVGGFSMHPDGTRFLTSVSILPYDIWMLEGFESSRNESDAR
jgi:Tol biopolymer transport system component